jgi:hypothetical protein
VLHDRVRLLQHQRLSAEPRAEEPFLDFARDHVLAFETASSTVLATSSAGGLPSFDRICDRRVTLLLDKDTGKPLD